MPELVIRLVALLGGVLVGVTALAAVALLTREQALVRSGQQHLGAARAVLLGLLVVMAVTWVVSPIHASPWIWPGVVVGIAGAFALFQLARTGRMAVKGRPWTSD